MLKPFIFLSTLSLSAIVHAQTTSGQVYKENCLACHMAQGQGIPGAFPALADNAFVPGDQSALPPTLLPGRGGMPASAGSMSDEQIAAVATHIRGSWGNRANAVTTTQVADLRKQGNSQQLGQAALPINH